MNAQLMGIGLAYAPDTGLERLDGQLNRLWPPDDDPAPRPLGHFLPARVRRRASRFTRWVADAFGQACASAGFDPGQVGIILASDLGEIAVTGEILTDIAAGERRFSPTRFHNSVHNTPTGYLSIATGNRLGSTAVSCGRHGHAAGWLEAMSLLPECAHVVLIVAEEGLPASLTPIGDRSQASDCGAAVAYALSREAEADQGRSPRPSWQLSLDRQGGQPEGFDNSCHADLHPALASACRLAEFLAREAQGRVALSDDGGEGSSWAQLGMRVHPSRTSEEA